MMREKYLLALLLSFAVWVFVTADELAQAMAEDENPDMLHGGDVEEIFDADDVPDLFRMIVDGDYTGLEESLQSGKDVDQIGDQGQTPLMFACLKGSLEAVKILLKYNADKTIGEKMGYTPLHGAAFQGRAAIAKYLIENGMDPMEFHKDGYSPFHRTLWGGEDRHTETLKVFLDAGVPPTFKSQSGENPVDMARSQASINLLNSYQDRDEL